MALEYDVRFGDPESQALFSLLDADCDLASLLLACAASTLETQSIRVRRGFCLAVVVAAMGYPGKAAIGFPVAIEAVQQGESVVWLGPGICRLFARLLS